MYVRLRFHLLANKTDAVPCLPNSVYPALRGNGRGGFRVTGPIGFAIGIHKGRSRGRAYLERWPPRCWWADLYYRSAEPEVINPRISTRSVICLGYRAKWIEEVNKFGVVRDCKTSEITGGGKRLRDYLGRKRLEGSLLTVCCTRWHGVKKLRDLFTFFVEQNISFIKNSFKRYLRGKIFCKDKREVYMKN